MQPGGVVANRFELLSMPVAHGGTAAIFRARDVERDTTVALKVSYGRNARDARRFAREAEYLERFDHDAIVRYVDHGSSDGIAYLAVEWLTGEDLARRLERVGLTLRETLIMASKVASALEHAHAHGVMHRDLNPENVFLVDSEVDKLKILDFGVAGHVDGRGTWDQMSGAAVYMSPEQLGGAVIDWRTDIFSFGCVFYECLAGRRAFGGETLMEIVNSVMGTEPPPLPALPSPIARSLEALVSQMLAKEPLDRPRASRIHREIDDMLRSLEPAQHVRARKTSRYMAGEKKLVCVAVAQPPDETAPLDRSTARMADANSNEVALATDVAGRFGASVAHVPGMGMLVVPDARFLVTDQIALVARCALALSEAMPELAVGIAARREVVEGDDGWPFGDAVTAASELASRGDRQVLIDRGVEELLGRRFRVAASEIGTVLRSYDPVGDVITTVGRDATFVGRERELTTLRAQWAQVLQQRQPALSFVVAPAGAGKSRLIREIVREIAVGDIDMTMLTGRGDPIGSGSPFAVAGQVLRSALVARARDAVPQVYAALRARIEAVGITEHVRKVEAYLGALLGLPSHDYAAELAWALNDPAAMSDGIRWAFSEWLRAEASRADLLVIVLEDMQWGDTPSARLISSALAAAEQTPMFIVAAVRPEGVERFPEIANVAERVVLEPLSSNEASQLALELLGERADEQEILTRLVQQGGGNPLYMRELAALPDDIETSLPETVLSTAQARLERLDAPARRILRAASVFGEVFWPSGIVTLLGQWHARELATWLPWLEAQGLIEERPHAELDGEPGYAFHAQLLREVAYAMLSDADRAACHRLAAEWLEQHRDADALTLAEQWIRGGAPARAVEHYRRAAEQALAGNDFRGAIDHAERAVGCGPRGALLGKLQLIMARAHEWATDNVACAERAEAAMKHLTTGGGAWFEAFQHAFASKVRIHGTAGVEQLCAQLEGLSGLIASEEEVVALARVSGLLTMYGDLDRGKHFFQRATHRVQQFETPAQNTLGWLAWARAWQAQAAGELAESLAHDVASLHAFEAAGDVRNVCYARSNIGYAHLRLGLFEESEQYLARALDTALRLDLRTIASGAAHNLGLVQGLLGSHEDALETELNAIALFTSLRSGRGETMATEYLARIHLLRGDVPKAELAARRARELAGQWQSLVAICCASVSRALNARGDHEGALTESRRAMDLLEMHGSADGEEHYIVAAFAESLVALGRGTEAAPAIDDACETLTAAASRIPDERMRQAFLQRVPEHHRLLTLSRAARRP